MSQEVIKVLEYISNKLGLVVDWTSERVLPYAQEVVSRFILYKTVSNAITFAIGVVLLIISVVIIYKLIKLCLECKRTKLDNSLFDYSKYLGVDITGLGIFLVVLSIILSIAGIASLIAGACGLLNWSLIPEVQLLKEVQYILK